MEKEFTGEEFIKVFNDYLISVGKPYYYIIQIHSLNPDDYTYKSKYYISIKHNTINNLKLPVNEWCVSKITNNLLNSIIEEISLFEKDLVNKVMQINKKLYEYLEDYQKIK